MMTATSARLDLLSKGVSQQKKRNEKKNTVYQHIEIQPNYVQDYGDQPNSRPTDIVYISTHRPWRGTLNIFNDCERWHREKMLNYWKHRSAWVWARVFLIFNNDNVIINSRCCLEYFTIIQTVPAREYQTVTRHFFFCLFVTFATYWILSRFELNSSKYCTVCTNNTSSVAGAHLHTRTHFHVVPRCVHSTDIL